MLSAVCLATSALIDVAPRPARAQVTPVARLTFPLRVHLVNDTWDHWHASLQWVGRQIDAANARFAAAGVQFAMYDWRPNTAEGAAWLQSPGRFGHATPTGWLGSARTLRAVTPDERVAMDVFVVAGIHDASGCSFGLALEPDPSGSTLAVDPA